MCQCLQSHYSTALYITWIYQVVRANCEVYDLYRTRCSTSQGSQILYNQIIIKDGLHTCACLVNYILLYEEKESRCAAFGMILL